MAAQDHYATLGIERSATASEVRKAYIGLARMHHPDHHGRGDSETAMRTMQQINDAWETLSDEASRHTYDHETAPKLPSPHHRVDVPRPSEPSDGGGIVVSTKVARALRFGPLVAAAVVGTLLVVLTAYAGGDGQVDDVELVQVGDCIRIGGPGAHVKSDCGTDNDGLVVRITSAGCAADERAFDPRTRDVTFCLEASG